MRMTDIYTHLYYSQTKTNNVNRQGMVENNTTNKTKTNNVNRQGMVENNTTNKTNK